jgi:hypothetical protein
LNQCSFARYISEKQQRIYSCKGVCGKEKERTQDDNKYFILVNVRVRRVEMKNIRYRTFRSLKHERTQLRHISLSNGFVDRKNLFRTRKIHAFSL